MLDTLLKDVAEALAERGDPIAIEVEVLAYSVMRRKHLKMERLKRQISQIQTYLLNAKDISQEYRDKLTEDLNDNVQKLNTLKGTDYIRKPNVVTPPSTVTPTVVVSPKTEVGR